ncbi:hypothetical protein DH09_08285 [Bacillaceae bacterium JMAK1]|nr:hypothetical protein DH09_08285 [Bacillaceae bacterium JMAK1]
MKEKHKQKRAVTIQEIIQSKCKHDWADLPKRYSRSDQDQQCKRCGLKQMQAAVKAKAIALTISPKPVNKIDTKSLSNYELRSLMGIDRQIHHRGRGGAFRSK